MFNSKYVGNKFIFRFSFKYFFSRRCFKVILNLNIKKFAVMSFTRKFAFVLNYYYVNDGKLHKVSRMEDLGVMRNTKCFELTAIIKLYNFW